MACRIRAPLSRCSCPLAVKFWHLKWCLCYLTARCWHHLLAVVKLLNLLIHCETEMRIGLLLGRLGRLHIDTDGSWLKMGLHSRNPTLSWQSSTLKSVCSLPLWWGSRLQQNSLPGGLGRLPLWWGWWRAGASWHQNRDPCYLRTWCDVNAVNLMGSTVTQELPSGHVCKGASRLG